MITEIDVAEAAVMLPGVPLKVTTLSEAFLENPLPDKTTGCPGGADRVSMPVTEGAALIVNSLGAVLIDACETITFCLPPSMSPGT